MAQDIRPPGWKIEDEEISPVAKKGKFRVIGVDTLDDSKWLEGEGDFDTFKLAREHAKEQVNGREGIKMYVYNDAGSQLCELGNSWGE